VNFSFENGKSLRTQLHIERADGVEAAECRALPSRFLLARAPGQGLEHGVAQPVAQRSELDPVDQIVGESKRQDLPRLVQPDAARAR